MLPLAKLLYHASPSEKKMPENGGVLPRFGITLDVLCSALDTSPPERHIWRPTTGVQGLPRRPRHEERGHALWILCSRRILQERPDVYGGRNTNLPKFGGLVRLEGPVFGL